MSFGSRWAAILLLCACALAHCVCISAAESRVIVILQDDAGEPLAGVSIDTQLIGGGLPPPSPFNRTDEEGRFETSLANGEWLIQADFLDLNQRGYLGASQQITLNNETRTVTLVARRPNTLLFGKITDDAGAPVSNVRVRAALNNNTFSAQTDAEGNYSIRLGEGQWWIRFEESELQEHGLILMETLFAAVVEGEDQRFDIQLIRPRLVLAANVRDTEGRPLANGSIDAIREGSFFRTTARIVDGVAELRLPSGPWIVSIAPFSGHKIPPRRRVVMTAERHQLDVTVEPQITVEVTGRVIDESGGAVPRVVIKVRPFSNQSGFIHGFPVAEDGTFAISADAGHILFTGDDNALIPRTILHAPISGRYEHVIQMQRATAEIVVRASSVGDIQTPVPMFTASTFHRGKFHTVTLPVWGEVRVPVFDADWRISVDNYGHDLQTAVPSVIAIRGQNETLDLRFAPAEQTARIRGRVVDPQNNPVQGMLICGFRDTLGHLWQEARTDANGAFDFSVAPGDWRVTADEELPGISRTSGLFAPGLQAGETRDMGSIHWPWSGARVVVRLTDETGKALNTDSPYLDPRQLRPRLRAEHARGFYEVTAPTSGNEFSYDVAPGKWTFHAWGGQLNGAGYAALRPVELDVAAPGATFNVPVTKLGQRSESPFLHIASPTGNNESLLTLFTEDLRPYRIETSTNLRDWTFYSFNEWNREMAVPNQPESRFFRAITEY